MAKKSAFSVRAISDLVVVREPERFVRLRIKLNKVAETILCPRDFAELIEALRSCSVGMGAVSIGKHGFQMARLGLVARATRGGWVPTDLLYKYADDLIEAFENRYYKMIKSDD